MTRYFNGMNLTSPLVVRPSLVEGGSKAIVIHLAASSGHSEIRNSLHNTLTYNYQNYQCGERAELGSGTLCNWYAFAHPRYTVVTPNATIQKS